MVEFRQKAIFYMECRVLIKEAFKRPGRYRSAVLAALSGLVFCFPAVSSAAPQDISDSTPEAYVTFYSNHITILGGTPGHRWGAFKGRLFDGVDQLAFMEPAHFITFKISPGTHVFTANSWMNKHSEHGAHMTIDIRPGRRYFIETGSFPGDFGIRNVNCQFAQSESHNIKSLEPAHFRSAGKTIAVIETSFPACPADDPQP
jgi:hypothetical protein